MLEQGGQGGEMVIVVAVKANDGKLDWVVDLNCGMTAVVDSGIVVCVIQVFQFFSPFPLESGEYSRQHGIGAHQQFDRIQLYCLCQPPKVLSPNGSEHTRAS
jgi:hypothetical protein